MAMGIVSDGSFLPRTRMFQWLTEDKRLTSKQRQSLVRRLLCECTQNNTVPSHDIGEVIVGCLPLKLMTGLKQKKFIKSIDIANIRIDIRKVDVSGAGEVEELVLLLLTLRNIVSVAELGYYFYNWYYHHNYCQVTIININTYQHYHNKCT